MTNEELFEIFGDIDDSYILEPTQTVKKSVNFKALAALAACFCVVMAAAVFARVFFFYPKGRRQGLPLYTADEVVRGGDPTNGCDEGHDVKPLANITREEALTDFGGLFPSEIIDGYELTSMGYQVAGTVDDLRLLHVIYYNKDNGETLMIEVSKKGRYHGSELNTVIVGDGHNFNGSEIYIDGGDYVIFYHMNKSNISEVDGFVEMVESSEYFSTRGVPLVFRSSGLDSAQSLIVKPLLRLNGQLYTSSGKNASEEPNTAEFDGVTTETVIAAGYIPPTEDGQANFGAGYGYRYGDDNTVLVYLKGKWNIFVPFSDESMEFVNEWLGEIGSLDSVLGFDDFTVRVEENGYRFYTWHFYAEVDGTKRCVAEMFGYFDMYTPEAFSVDLDGDGIDELICNCTGGDGWRTVTVYRRNGGKIEEGHISGLYDELGAVNFGLSSFTERYDPERGFVITYYTEMPHEADEPERKEYSFKGGIENFEFYPFTPEDEYYIFMDSIYLNGIDSIYSAAMKYYDPEEYVFRDMTDGEVAEHYGRDPAPVYIPEGMSVERSQKFVISNSDEVCEDGVHIILSYDAPAENGQPQGITVSAAKVGMLTDALYILPENETQISNICGVGVTFGYRQMSYGPYENPRGYYDLYEADFEIDDIRYQVVAKQISLEEAVKVVASIIAETDRIAVTD